MNVQENVPSPTQSTTSTTPVQRIMPLLYVNQANLKPPTPIPSPSNTGTSAPSGTTIVTAMPQIQLASSGNPQIIHSSTNPNTYSFLPLYHQAKPIKETQKKVYVASTNSNNNKSNQVNLILPSNQNSNSGNKSPMTGLILPQMSTMANKGTITGMILPNNNAGVQASNNKPAMASVLLPSNAKYPNIAPNKKVPIPNIIVPPQNVSKPNIIRQSNNPLAKNVVGILSPSANAQMTSLLLTQNTNPSNKQPPTSVGLILPTSGASHSLIVSQPTPAQTHSILVPQSSNGQSHSIIVPQSAAAQQHGIIMPVSQPPGGQSQLTNLIITSTTPSVTTPAVGSLLISNASPSLLMSQSCVSSSSASAANNNILIKTSVTHCNCSSCNGKKNFDHNSIIFAAARENKQSLLMKPNLENNCPTMPPLQPISSKDAGVKPILPKTANGIVVPESLTMTPITDCDLVKPKPEQISDDITIERTSSVTTYNKATSVNLLLRSDEKGTKIEEEISRTDSGVSPCPISLLRGCEQDNSLVLDGEVTMRRLGPDRDVAQEKKQLDDDVKIELVKPKATKSWERQKPPPPRYQKPEDLNPMEVLEWDHQGVGKLPGSNIKFRINEFGLDLVVDNNKEESPLITPHSSCRNSDDKPANNKLPTTDAKPAASLFGEGNKLYCCEGCGCYGLYTEFLMDTRFCSVGCKKIVLARNEVKKKRHEDKLKELRLRRKKRKIKVLTQRAKRGSVDQTTDKDFGTTTNELVNESDIMNSVWSNKLADIKKAKRIPDGQTNNQHQDMDSANDSSQFTNCSTPSNSDSESSAHGSRSQPGSSNHSEDGNSSGKTAVTTDSSKETSLINSSGEFVWQMYLQKYCNKAKAAPERLFKDPFPYGKSGFKVGMKLEGIDPEHQAIISVLTVGQVKGHRLRLHFDGYPDHHDFWVNSDSPDIFPPGWCEKNNHTLHPPQGYTMDNFSWNTYLKQCRAQPAPKPLFPKSNSPICPSQFRIGMKLEAVDRKNSSLICVASVSDLIDNRLLIHFDSWGDVYDYWTDPSSPYIHPVGWCEENGYDLTPPNSFKNPNAFSWESYLKETKSHAAPARAFKPRPPNGFKRGMKLEAIDKRVPSMLRPATIREVKDFQIKITFDGYPEEFGYWIEDDCPDIHPIGWGQKTGYPVTSPPLSVGQVKSLCGIKGCVGEGNIRGGSLTAHTAIALCPYSPQNLSRETAPDRFCMNPGFYEVPEPINKSKVGKQDEKKDNNISGTKQDAADDSSCSESRIKTRHSSLTPLKDDSKLDISIKTEPQVKSEEKIERRGRKRKLPEAENKTEHLDKLRKELIQSVFEPEHRKSQEEQEMWAKHMTTLSHKVNVTGGDPSSWNHKQVAAFVNTVIPSRAKLFLDQEIDGESFLMLTQNDLTKVLGLKLGPALKIFNCIILLRKKSISL